MLDTVTIPTNQVTHAVGTITGILIVRLLSGAVIPMRVHADPRNAISVRKFARLAASAVVEPDGGIRFGVHCWPNTLIAEAEFRCPCGAVLAHYNSEQLNWDVS
jgi:hypothetical protein